ncbi:hypothetical protein AALO_G00173590 [Alosa alosa]|uniref:Uncharacterized protein n=1 Tax=Alosa alosa TaxID=278164 RepID=A0AAV6G9X7_9TELE|nr:uncharacterized protein LOC125305601 isoform X1 [Alosa alosa]KAG5270902.1 hypothetical protein AALO_G00173590 [Alosa alosa]
MIHIRPYHELCSGIVLLCSSLIGCNRAKGTFVKCFDVQLRLVMAASASIPPYPPEIRLVLLGSVDEGKRSAGNTILGREEFSSQKTAECVTKHGWVGPRQVTVINTPGWGREQRLSQTPVNVRQQLLQSVFPPGAHALILVIRADRNFTESNRVALQDHMELLGERVWDHTIVLFTCVDWLGDAPIEKFITSEGMPLQWVVEKSSYKYYCINNSDRADTTQVSRLLEMIEMVVAGNQGHFELDRETCEREKERAEDQKKAIQVMQQRALEMRKSWHTQPPIMRRQSYLLNPPKMSGGTYADIKDMKIEVSAEEPGAYLTPPLTPFTDRCDSMSPPPSMSGGTHFFLSTGEHGDLTQHPTPSSYHNQSKHRIGPKLVPSYDQHSCSPGDDPILSCHFPSKTNAVVMEIRWFKGTDCIYLYKDGQEREGRGYEGRVSLSKGKLKKGSINLTLRKIQQNDIGNYVCQILHEHGYECAFRINYSPYNNKFVIYPGPHIADEDRVKMEASTQDLVSGGPQIVDQDRMQLEASTQDSGSSAYLSTF